MWFMFTSSWHSCQELADLLFSFGDYSLCKICALYRNLKYQSYSKLYMCARVCVNISDYISYKYAVMYVTKFPQLSV